MNNIDFTAWEGVFLALGSIYSLGQGVLIAIIASFVTTRFIPHRTYEETYLIFSLAIGGAVVGLLLTLPVSIELLLCTHLSRTCNKYLRPVLEISFQAVMGTPSLGAIVGLVAGYWKLFTEYR